MATVDERSVLAALSGSIGKEIVFKRYGNKTVVSRYPDMSRVKATERQRQQRHEMRLANAYAKLVTRSAFLRGLHEAVMLPGESVFHRAKKEWFMKGGDE